MSGMSVALACEVLAASHPAPVNQIAHSADLLATADTDLRLRLWKGGKLVHAVDLATHDDHIRPTERCRGLAFSPDGRWLWAAAANFVAKIEVGSGRVGWRYVVPRSYGFLVMSPLCLDVDPSGCAVVGMDNGTLTRLDPETDQALVWKDNEAPRWLRVLGEGRAAGSDGFHVSVWDTETRRRVRSHRPSRRVFGFDAHPSGLAAIRMLTECRNVDLESGEVLGHAPVERGLPIVRFSPDGERFALLFEESVAVFHRDGAAVRRFEAGEVLVSMVWDGDAVLSGTRTGRVLRWEG